MDKKELNEAIKNYIKENVKVLVETRRTGSECHTNRITAVNLYVENVLISSSEIEDLEVCY